MPSFLFIELLSDHLRNLKHRLGIKTSYFRREFLADIYDLLL